MSNQLVILTGGAVPAAFQNFANAPDMVAAAQANLQASFGVIGYKGKNWRIKYRGEEILVKDARGLPEAALDVVIVGVSPHISKAFYDKKWTEGDSGPPDCYSVNGDAPDATSPKKQCASCAACPQNVWGSKVTDQGKKAKACQDSRRIAVTPLADILNVDFGGPMLLSLPPMSLSGLSAYAKELGRFGAQPFMVATQMTFDSDLAYPMINFKATRWLVEDEAVLVKEALEDKQIGRMLTEEVKIHDESAATEATAGLAGGAAPAAFSAEALAEQAELRAQVAREEAKAKHAAEVEAEVQAAIARTQAAPTEKKSSPFNKAPSQAAAPAASQTPGPGLAEVVAEVVTKAPADMESMIDDLLAN